MPGEVNIAMTREHHNMKSALLVFGSALLLAAVTAPADGKIVKNGDTIVLVGDSITQYGAKSETGYVQLFVRGLKATGVDFKWIGAGIAGNKSTDMRNRFDADVPLMLEHLPNEEEYCFAAAYIRSVADKEGIPI